MIVANRWQQFNEDEDEEEEEMCVKRLPTDRKLKTKKMRSHPSISHNRGRHGK